MSEHEQFKQVQLLMLRHVLTVGRVGIRAKNGIPNFLLLKGVSLLFCILCSDTAIKFTRITKSHCRSL